MKTKTRKTRGRGKIKRTHKETKQRERVGDRRNEKEKRGSEVRI